MRLALAACILFLSTLASAQSEPVQEVGLCQLRQHATEFDHKMVRVRGTVSFGFEDFSLFDSQCPAIKSTVVWLTFGGDVSDPLVYCCGDHSRAPGDNLHIDGKPIPITKDPAYEQFGKLLRASRNRRPNGEPCENGCNFYRVSATLIGLFLAEKDTGKEHIGYGHLGCCSLLVIQHVSDVSAVKTGVPTGTFACERSLWTTSPANLPELDAYLVCKASCDKEDEALVKRIAAHWWDPVTVAQGHFSGTYIDTKGTDQLSWISQDLLTSYVLSKEKTTRPLVSLTRENCRNIHGQRAEPQTISCDEYATHPDLSPELKRAYDASIEKGDSQWEKMLLDADEQLSSQGDRSWRRKPLLEAAKIILKRELQGWGVKPNPDLRLEKCTKPESFEGWHFVGAHCDWYSPDGMQEFSVSFDKRKPSPGGSARSPWLLHSVSARICHADPSLATANIQPN